MRDHQAAWSSGRHLPWPLGPALRQAGPPRRLPVAQHRACAPTASWPRGLPGRGARPEPRAPLLPGPSGERASRLAGAASLHVLSPPVPLVSHLGNVCQAREHRDFLACDGEPQAGRKRLRNAPGKGPVSRAETVVGARSWGDEQPVSGVRGAAHLHARVSGGAASSWSGSGPHRQEEALKAAARRPRTPTPARAAAVGTGPRTARPTAAGGRSEEVWEFLGVRHAGQGPATPLPAAGQESPGHERSQPLCLPRAGPEDPVCGRGGSRPWVGA